MPSSESYVRVDSVDSQTAAVTTPQHDDDHDERNDDRNDDNDEDDGDDAQLQDQRSLHEQQQQPLQPKAGPPLKTKQKKFAHQRSILKNSQEHTSEELELLEAKKQMILRRRRLFSHYRQYEQWRKRQFSYDPSYYRASPLPIGQASCSEYGGAAFRKRRQYRRQYSCAERSGEDSRESRESSSLHKYQGNDTILADSAVTTTAVVVVSSSQHATQTDDIRHFHMLPEESTAIAERCTRSRINSAIFVSSEGRGFDSIEFLRRHGSQSVLCRKARSAENITDNGRKKSFSDKRHWPEDDEVTDGRNDKNDTANNSIELQERHRPSSETRTLSVLQANNNNSEQMLATIAGTATSVLGAGHSAAVTTSTSNMVVGSISIEAPPAYIKEDLQLQLQLHPSIASTNSTSHDSTDTVEELILIPTAPEATRSRVLVHQRSSTSSNTNRSQSPALSSAHSSPRALSLKGVKPKVGTLPMVSVSEPSPPHEKQPLPPLPPPPAECL